MSLTKFNKKPKVIYWNNIPSPYMVDRFNSLAQRDNLEFEVWFNSRNKRDRSWRITEKNWKFKYRYVPTINIFGVRVHMPPVLFCRQKPDLIVSLYAEPVFIAGLVISKIRGIKTGLRVLKTFDEWVKRNWLKEILKQFIFKRMDFIETPGSDGELMALKYSAKRCAIFKITHTVDLKLLAGSKKEIIANRELMRKEIGLVGVTFIYVGRLWLGKGLKYLLESFQIVQGTSNSTCSLLLVGDGEDERNIRDLCEKLNLNNVIFVGFQQKENLPKYYYSSDVFVFPTLGDPYGIVVDEAMACSLPIISTDSAGEIYERVVEGVNGYVVPSKDSMKMAEFMSIFVKDDKKAIQMGKASYNKVQGHTPDCWAEQFETAVLSILQPANG